MILEDTEIAIDKADSLASELCIVRPELRSRGCAVRVTDADSEEFHRTPIDLNPRGEIVLPRVMGVRRGGSRIWDARRSYFLEPRYVAHAAPANNCDVC